jgi:hypothetical protein
LQHTRIITDFAGDIEKMLEDHVSKFAFYSVAVNDNTDTPNAAHLATLFRGEDKNFNVTEELAALFPM